MAAAEPVGNGPIGKAIPFAGQQLQEGQEGKVQIGEKDHVGVKVDRVRKENLPGEESPPKVDQPNNNHNYLDISKLQAKPGEAEPDLAEPGVKPGEPELIENFEEPEPGAIEPEPGKNIEIEENREVAIKEPGAQEEPAAQGVNEEEEVAEDVATEEKAPVIDLATSALTKNFGDAPLGFLNKEIRGNVLNYLFERLGENNLERARLFPGDLVQLGFVNNRFQLRAQNPNNPAVREIQGEDAVPLFVPLGDQVVELPIKKYGIDIQQGPIADKLLTDALKNIQAALDKKVKEQTTAQGQNRLSVSHETITQKEHSKSELLDIERPIQSTREVINFLAQRMSVLLTRKRENKEATEKFDEKKAESDEHFRRASEIRGEGQKVFDREKAEILSEPITTHRTVLKTLPEVDLEPTSDDFEEKIEHEKHPPAA